MQPKKAQKRLSKQRVEIFFLIRSLSSDRLIAIQMLEAELRNEEEKRRQLIEVSHDDR